MKVRSYYCYCWLGLDLKSESRFEPTGILSFELVPCHKMSAECGTVFGTNVVDIIRAMQILPRFPGYTQADGSDFVKNAGGSSSSGVSPKSVINSPTAAASNGGTSKGNNNNSDNSSVVSSTSTTALLASNSAIAPIWSIPHRKMWIAILSGKIYVYLHFGDQLKLIVNMEYFTASTVKKSNAVVYRLEKHGYPGFSFTSQTPEDSLRWKCAFICSTGSQQFAKDKFDMNLLINDIVKMEKELAPQRSTKVANVFFNALKRNSTAGGSQLSQFSPALTRQSTRSSWSSADLPSDISMPTDKWDDMVDEELQQQKQQQIQEYADTVEPSRPATSQKTSLYRGNSVVLSPVSSLPASTSSSLQSTPSSIKMLSSTGVSPSRGNLLAPLGSSPVDKSPKSKSRKGRSNAVPGSSSSGNRDIPPIGNVRGSSLRFSLVDETAE